MKHISHRLVDGHNSCEQSVRTHTHAHTHVYIHSYGESIVQHLLSPSLFTLFLSAPYHSLSPHSLSLSLQVNYFRERVSSKPRTRANCLSLASCSGHYFLYSFSFIYSIDLKAPVEGNMTLSFSLSYFLSASCYK